MHHETTKDVVVLGASAGGVEALLQIVGALPADLPAAVFVVLHLPAHSPSGLQSVLQRGSAMPVVVPADGAAIQKGHVYVAPTDRHLMIGEGVIRITRGPKECRARPAVDVLFRSAAAQFGNRVVGVILTGMLDDGTAGLWAVKDHGGTAIVQDPIGALHPAMPRSAIAHVQVDVVAPLSQIARILVELAGSPTAAPKPVSSAERAAIENLIARSGNGLQAGVMTIGQLSRYTCPACNGVLVQIEEGSIVRFRCHTGHAYSLQTLLAEVNSAVDEGLWDALRALEERIMLLRQMADLAEDTGLSEDAGRFIGQVEKAEKRVAQLRALVLDPHVSGNEDGR